MRRSPLLLAAALGGLLLTACGGDPAPAAAPSARPSASASSSASSSASASPTGSAPSTGPAERPEGTLAFSDCGDGFECADLPVEVEGATVDLAVLRRPAVRDRIGVLLVNPGGPGASAVDYLRLAYEGLPERVRTRFDVVAVDPRGVGESDPVECADTAELDDFFALDPTPDDPGELDAFAAGQAALAGGCQQGTGPLLGQVGTVEAAQDMDRLRAALGEERVSYLGYSYGTSIGAQYAEAFPDRVRAMVLDGAIDPALTWDALLAGQSQGFDRALQAFAEDCTGDGCAFAAATGETTPEGLLRAFDALRERVDDGPLTVGPRLLGPGEFDIGVLSGLYDQEYGWPALGEALASVLDGEGEGLLALSDTYLERTEDGYAQTTESNLAVLCLDRPWPRERQPYVDLAERVRRTAPRFGPAIALSGLVCSSWPVPPTGRPAPVDAAGAPPLLVVGTTGDPATPFAWSQALADQLDSGVLLTHVGEGHTVYRAGAPDCVVDAVDAYLLTAEEPQPVRC